MSSKSKLLMTSDSMAAPEGHSNNSQKSGTSKHQNDTSRVKTQQCMKCPVPDGIGRRTEDNIVLYVRKM